MTVPTTVAASGPRRSLLFAAALLVALIPTAAGAAQPGSILGAPPISWLGGGTIGVQGIAVSPDGQTLATAAGDNTVKLWRVSDQRLIRTLVGHQSTVSSVAFSPNGQFVASGGDEALGSSIGHVKLWRVSDGAFLFDFKVPAGSGLAYSVAVSPDGTLLASAHANGNIYLLRMSDGALVRTLSGHTDQVFAVAFSPDGTMLASGSGDRTVRIWRVSTGTQLRRLTGHTFLVTAVAFSPDGTTLASGSFDSTVKLWRTSNFSLIRTLTHPDAVSTVAFSADSQTLASGGSNFDTRLWRVSTGVLLRTLPGSQKHSVSSLRFIGSATIAAGGFDGHGRLWRAADGLLRATFGEHTAAVRGVAFSPDGTVLASAGDDTLAKLWRAADGVVLRTLDGHTDVVNAVAFAPDGARVATAAGSPPPFTTDTRINVWSTSGTLLSVLAGHGGGSTGVAFSADGQTIVSSGRDNTLRFWRASDGTLLRAVTAGSPNGALAISRDRLIVAVPSAGTAINIYSTVDGTLMRTAHTTSATVSSLSFSGDGSLLAAGEDAFGNNVEIFRVADATLVRTLAGDPNGFVQGVAFAPNGATLASGSGFSHVIQLWDPATGVLRAEFDSETGAGPFPSLPLAYSPDSSQLGYGRGDATVVLARP